MTMQEVARALVEKPKGIFAADESGGSTEKRFATYGIECTEETRRQYRQLFFTTPGVEKYVSGVILFDETARQLSDDGQPLRELLSSKGIIPGIKVDKGLVPLEGSKIETITSGLDDLPERLSEYAEMGLKFAKWRAALKITENTPTREAIVANTEILARYALDCQNAGIVPIVEPEVMLEGDHSLEECKKVLGDVLDEQFVQLKKLGVDLSAVILKTSMALSGSAAAEQANVGSVARATVDALVNHVPHELAGIVFLSGGQTAELATDHLAEITQMGPHPWNITFSYSRALQVPAIEAWLGKPENIPAAQDAFLERVIANSDAVK